MAEVDLGRVQGFSAYEVAKQNGYVGTEAQWLESLHGPKGDDGAPGKDGVDGASAGFGTPMASVDANVGTPSVTIEASGSNAAKVFKFIFKNLKGEKGDKGERGPAGSVVVDDALSSTSENPVQNKVVNAEFDKVDSNLTDLKVSDIAGGKNLADINAFKKLTIAEKSDRYGYEWLDMKGGSYTFTITNNSRRVYLGYEHEGVVTNPYSVGNETANFTITINDHDSIAVWYDENVKINTITKIQLEKGTQATDYEPYIPSVKMLAEENAQQDNNLSLLDASKLKGYTVKCDIPANTGGWHKIAQVMGLYFNFDLYVMGSWHNRRQSNAHFQIQNINGTVRIVQLSGMLDSTGIGKIRMVRVSDDRNTWILEEYSVSSLADENYRFTIAGDVIVTPLDGSVDTSTDFKDSVSLDVSDIPTGAVITTSNVDNALSSTSTYPVQNKVVNEAITNIKDGTTPAAKAVADGEGNNIAATYAKKTEIPGGGSTAENVTVVAVSGVSQSVVNNSKCKNDRVVLGFYITVAAGAYTTIRIADITSDHGPTEVVYGTAVCTTKYSSFDEYTKPYPFQVNKAKSIYLKINETFATDMIFYISLAYDIK